MRIIIDRFEEKFAVCELEDGTFEEISREFFPDAKEGDVFDIVITKNETESNDRKEQAKSLFEKLKNLKNT